MKSFIEYINESTKEPRREKGWWKTGYSFDSSLYNRILKKLNVKEHDFIGYVAFKPGSGYLVLKDKPAEQEFGIGAVMLYSENHNMYAGVAKIDYNKKLFYVLDGDAYRNEGVQKWEKLKPYYFYSGRLDSEIYRRNNSNEYMNKNYKSYI